MGGRSREFSWPSSWTPRAAPGTTPRSSSSWEISAGRGARRTRRPSRETRWEILSKIPRGPLCTWSSVAFHHHPRRGAALHRVRGPDHHVNGFRSDESSGLLLPMPRLLLSLVFCESYVQIGTTGLDSTITTSCETERKR